MWNQISGNKYRAKRTEYSGKTYRSKLEAAYAQELDLRVKAKDIKSWEYEKESISLKVYNVIIDHYRPDFLITHNDDSLEIVETKGFWTPEAKRKWKHFEAQYSVEHPEVKLTVVKQSGVRFFR